MQVNLNDAFLTLDSFYKQFVNFIIVCKGVPAPPPPFLRHPHLDPA